MDRTLEYYDGNAKAYAESTVSVEFSIVRQRFLAHIPVGSKILDFGCGSGRDTKCFLDMGYKVDAVDGSAALCRIAQNYTGIEVRHMLFQELGCQDCYDGIWACASILHLPKNELSDVFTKMAAALRDGGVLYTSFKYGTFEGERSGRYFTYFNKETFLTFAMTFPELELRELWISEDARADRQGEQWLNVILKKKNFR